MIGWFCSTSINLSSFEFWINIQFDFRISVSMPPVFTGCNSTQWTGLKCFGRDIYHHNKVVPTRQRKKNWDIPIKSLTWLIASSYTGVTNIAALNTECCICVLFKGCHHDDGCWSCSTIYSQILAKIKTFTHPSITDNFQAFVVIENNEC